MQPQERLVDSYISLQIRQDVYEIQRIPYNSSSSNKLSYLRNILFGSRVSLNKPFFEKIRTEKSSPYDFPLIGRYFVLGSTVFPVSLYYWFRFLDKKMVGTAMKVVVPKVIVDQLVSSPYMLATFFIGMSIMEGKKDIFEECKEKMWPSYQVSYFLFYRKIIKYI
ncbi:unnamed protein product [Lepeophtheirus salmonis]|uniref:(salmon louse) hypothetical protein n=1 Tax=Lepeophtheirus salmonis TaxID=72036 RepID=A0A7R8CGX2_LEPSM|nr:unnamed protein product [Lepeophtheirus salmonis]CAF2780086.1 unnamed protein product [Lepeophtheirus salmonis]